MPIIELPWKNGEPLALRYAAALESAWTFAAES